MHLDQFYPLFFNQPQIASKRIHRLFNFLLTNGYVDLLLLIFPLPLWPARARQLQRRSRRIFSFDSVTPSQWDDFSAHVDNLCNISPVVFTSWHVNRMCEYLHTNIIAGANAILPARTVEKEFQDSSIKAHLASRDQNFDTDISSFINSALSRSRHRIMLDHVFIDHPTTPQLLTDPKDISDAVVNYFQNAVPIKSSPPSSISALPDRWRSEYSPMDSVSPDIYSSLLSPPSLEEWLSTVSSMPNGKAPGPSMITYEMLKHLGPIANSLLLILIRKCFASANIPDLWRQAMVFPIPKPHEWRCQLKNTRPITLLEVIRKSFVKLFYNRLSTILAAHNVLKGGNFAGLPGGTCRDPIITLESIIHDTNHTNSPLWILSQDISKAFDSVNLTMLKFALERIRLPATAITLILSLFMNHSNRVFAAHGETSSYRVRIGIDQGKVISPLLWVIYIDPLLTVLKNEMLDPYILRSPSLVSDDTAFIPNISINNLKNFTR
ncbi:RNA-directed DNA polymerase from mobile element jockey-like [Rhizophagus clarus]|uniref:RNA-directed DNA polymerase from mobile element jockey-like n=1 Tax=Rhizophagus clarus TaxID=94130 RepID=A0A8H3M3M0_9GLOM|nr:RNA-directed DNA polymerase from mobile element jockey-like [Rhizophagus clarus]